MQIKLSTTKKVINNIRFFTFPNFVNNFLFMNKKKQPFGCLNFILESLILVKKLNFPQN